VLIASPPSLFFLFPQRSSNELPFLRLAPHRFLCPPRKGPFFVRGFYLEPSITQLPRAALSPPLITGSAFTSTVGDIDVPLLHLAALILEQGRCWNAGFGLSSVDSMLELICGLARARESDALFFFCRGVLALRLSEFPKLVGRQPSLFRYA